MLHNNNNNNDNDDDDDDDKDKDKDKDIDNNNNNDDNNNDDNNNDDDAVVFANSNPDAKFEPNTVVLKDFSLKKMLEYITLKHSDYQFYYLIDSSVLLNGYRLFKLLASLLPQDDVMLGVQRKSFS